MIFFQCSCRHEDFAVRQSFPDSNLYISSYIIWHFSGCGIFGIIFSFMKNKTCLFLMGNRNDVMLVSTTVASAKLNTFTVRTFWLNLPSKTYLRITSLFPQGNILNSFDYFPFLFERCFYSFLFSYCFFFFLICISYSPTDCLRYWLFNFNHPV